MSFLAPAPEDPFDWSFLLSRVNQETQTEDEPAPAPVHHQQVFVNPHEKPAIIPQPALVPQSDPVLQQPDNFIVPNVPPTIPKRGRPVIPDRECHNCGLRNDKRWRRDYDGNTLCNACGQYLVRHKETRPQKLWKKQEDTTPELMANLHDVMNNLTPEWSQFVNNL